mmetsp:Transcript_19408/g.45145  ORF Transcript_19408/g.45145 Transcript_19408/m.45145 type:complete len:308 (-) Transcript_19408:1709-2632(-)
MGRRQIPAEQIARGHRCRGAPATGGSSKVQQVTDLGGRGGTKRRSWSWSAEGTKQIRAGRVRGCRCPRRLGALRLFGVRLRLELLQYDLFLGLFARQPVVRKVVEVLFLVDFRHLDHLVDPVGRPDDRSTVLAGVARPEAALGFLEVGLDPHPVFFGHLALQDLQPGLVRDESHLGVVSYRHERILAGAGEPQPSQFRDVAQQVEELSGGLPDRTALVDGTTLQRLKKRHRPALLLRHQNGVEFQQGLDAPLETVGVVDRLFGAVHDDVLDDDQCLLDRESRVIEGPDADGTDEFEDPIARDIVVGE